ncbi:MAG: putative oxidoreductase [Gemmatimonadetes bacterium]|nr:putative oxidoreductase [Gemmatimonadota bacterium]
MPHTRSFSRFGALALLIAAACSKPDAAPARQNSAGGDVAAQPATAGASGLKDSVSTKADLGRIRGSESAPVWLIEISDFQCPYCKQWHDQTFAKLDKEYVQTGKVRLAYINYPIPSLHPNAKAASEAAMCASVQGKFWPLHESLFITQEKWAKLPTPMPHFDSLATAAGADMPAWRACMSSHATLPLIDADHENSAKAGVQSTPTFFVGGATKVGIAGAYPVDSFRVLIDKALLAAAKPKP